MRKALRIMAVEHIAEHASDVRYNNLIQLSMREEFPRYVSGNAALDAYKFLNILSKNGIYGKSETLLALASIFLM